jgi:hypothetical protein
MLGSTAEIARELAYRLYKNVNRFMSYPLLRVGRSYP